MSNPSFCWECGGALDKRTHAVVDVEGAERHVHHSCEERMRPRTYPVNVIPSAQCQGFERADFVSPMNYHHNTY